MGILSDKLQHILARINWVNLYKKRRGISGTLNDQWYVLKMEKEVLGIGKHLVLLTQLVQEFRRRKGIDAPYDKKDL